MKLLQGFGVGVGCELLQTKVKKYHGNGCVSYINCCKEKGHRFSTMPLIVEWNGTVMLLYHYNSSMSIPNLLLKINFAT